MRTISIKDYAEAAGISREAVYASIKRGTLPSEVKAKKISGAWMLTIPDKFTPTRGKAGRPSSR